MELVIDTHIKTLVQFHDILNGFRAGRGIGITTMKLKRAHELVSVYQDPLLLVFIDLSKTHDNLYHGQLLQILVEYGAGPKLRGLLTEFWAR